MACCDVKLTPGQFHCVLCCNTFGSLALFDDHQVVKYEPRVLRCRDMSRNRRLVLHRGVWRTREDAAALEEKITKMHTARKKGV